MLVSGTGVRKRTNRSKMIENATENRQKVSHFVFAAEQARSVVSGP
jgi:hypothetical protein